MSARAAGTPAATQPAAETRQSSGSALTAVGGDQRTWLVQRAADEASASIYLRIPTDQPSQVYHAGRYKGRIADSGIAGDNEQLWLVYQDGTITRLTASSDGPANRWQFNQGMAATLPTGSLRATTAAGGQLWALMRQSPAATQPDTQAATGPATGPEADSSRDGSTGEVRDRLLVLRRGDWEAVPLPERWPGRAQAWLIHGPSQGSRPRLATRLSDRPDAVRVYRWVGERWQGRDYVAAGDAPLQFTLANEQLIFAQQAPEASGLEIAVFILRNGQKQQVGRLAMSGVASQAPWSITPDSVGVSVYAARAAKDGPPGTEDKSQPGSKQRNGNASSEDTPEREQGIFRWLAGARDQGPTGPVDVVVASLSLQGQTLQQPVQLAIEPPAEQTLAPTIVVVSTLAVALMLMMVFWRRDTVAAPPSLPQQSRIAAVPKRAIAGLLDLAPAMVLGMAAFDLGPVALLRHWPGQPEQPWLGMLAGTVTILIMVAHTTLGEMIWGRSLGKALTGLRVVNLEGQPARPWQVLVRNALKILDMIVWPLLVLAIIPPRHQRLGDLVGQTLIIEQTESETTEPSDNE